jgi:hypothetical protein
VGDTIAGKLNPRAQLKLVPQLSRSQMIFLWLPAAVVGLVLAEALHAGVVASVGLVAGVGILFGLLWAAWAQLHRSR